MVSSNMATNFAEDESVMAILGDFTSGACKANAEIVDRYGIVQLSPFLLYTSAHSYMRLWATCLAKLIFLCWIVNGS